MVLKRGHFRKKIRYNWKALKCGAGEGRKRPIGLIVKEMKKCYTESRRAGISYMQYKEGRLTGLVTSCVGTALYNTLLKERWREG
jgi:hypothetical protein